MVVFALGKFGKLFVVALGIFFLIWQNSFLLVIRTLVGIAVAFTTGYILLWVPGLLAPQFITCPGEFML